jgi:hypothetical protein
MYSMIHEIDRYTVKKVSDFPIPSRDVTYGTKLSLAGNNLIIPGQGELVSDILAGDGKIVNFFYSVVTNVQYSQCRLPRGCVSLVFASTSTGVAIN